VARAEPNDSAVAHTCQENASGETDSGRGVQEQFCVVSPEETNPVRRCPVAVWKSPRSPVAHVQCGSSREILLRFSRSGEDLMPASVQNGSRPYHGLIHGDSLDILPLLEKGSIDLTLTSPPYYLGKKYDTSTDLREFKKLHERILPEVVRVTKEGGSICWQVGYHVLTDSFTPLDFIVHSIMQDFDHIHLRNRVIWEFGHGHHLTKRFSGRHEVLLWYTHGKEYFFDLDAVRVPQKYPGKLRYKGANKGEASGNPLGKNPSDVWDFPNVKSAHIEKTEHPCQFPIALAQRVIRAFTRKNEMVLDPFAGVATTAVAAILEDRNYTAVEMDQNYINLAGKRIELAINGSLRYRDDSPPLLPDPSWKVSRPPEALRP
jgi:adenine-specific DNA-methyltransferase